MADNVDCCLGIAINEFLLKSTHQLTSDGIFMNASPPTAVHNGTQGGSTRRYSYIVLLESSL